MRGVMTAPKLARMIPNKDRYGLCSCGSGRKFKFCHYTPTNAEFHNDKKELKFEKKNA
jgi:CDGSH-type Zn-finger protein